MIAKTFRQKHDFLKHLKSSSSAWREAAIVNLSFHKFRAAPRVEGNAKTRFPSDRFGDLILTGFATRPWAQEPWMRLNIRDVLITLLLHGGGLRVSEPFHMYVNDVTPDPLDSSKALVRIGHPTWGEISWREPSGRLVTTTRAEYLARKGLPQRELVAGPMRAGWKNPLLDGKFYLEVRWAHPDYSRLFLKLWEHYLGEYLSLPSPPTHPWAWVSFDPKNIGSPLKIQRYLDAHDRAVRRIALPLGRANGTNPHAHRHSYGYWLESLGLKREVIRRFMHHASLSSQDAYKQESDHDLHNALTAGIDRLRQCTPAVMGPVQQQQDSSLLANSLLQTARNGTGGYDAERVGAAFDSAEVERLASLLEKQEADVFRVSQEMTNVFYVIGRCIEVLRINKDEGNNEKLVALGTITDVRATIEQVDSELLATSGVCLDAELYPELEAEATGAILRRSQLLDMIRMRDRGHVPLLMFDKRLQLEIGNRITERMIRAQEAELRAANKNIPQGKLEVLRIALDQVDTSIKRTGGLPMFLKHALKIEDAPETAPVKAIKI